MIPFADSQMAYASPPELAIFASYGLSYVPGGYNKGAGWSPIAYPDLYCPPLFRPAGAAPLDPRSFPPQHGKNYNFACCDGHVEGMPPSMLLNPTNCAFRWNYDHQPHPETWGGAQWGCGPEEQPPNT
jgi:prepilin-type processing-associated H-X9-DG protein